MQIDVVLPAGGRISGEFADRAAVSVKALIEINGVTILQHTIETLRTCGRIGKIVVVGPDEVNATLADGLADKILPETSSGPENILKGLDWIERDGGAGRRSLILTTDLPFLTTGAIESFLDACPDQLDICAPVNTKQEFLERFPGSNNEYVRLGDGEWTMGCAFLVNPGSIIANHSRIDQVFQARKSQIGMAKLLGMAFVFRYLTGGLTIAQIEKRCQDILGCSAAAIRGASVELAFDLDKIEEYHYALDHCRGV